MLDCITKDINFRKFIKLWCLYLVQHVLHQIKAPQFYADLYLQRQYWILRNVNGKIQGLSKAMSIFPEIQFSRDFQVLFKPVWTLFWMFIKGELKKNFVCHINFESYHETAQHEWVSIYVVLHIV